MNINIQKGMTIDAIKRQFSLLFPYLKLEFFLRQTVPGHSPAELRIAPGNALVEHIQPRVCPGVLYIDDTTTAGAMEMELANRFLLNAQVFRRSGNVWLETSATDGWALVQHNQHAQKISNHPPDSQEPEEYELHRNED